MTPMLEVSPLSPERVCAILASGTFIPAPRREVRISSRGNQRRPVGHDLANGRAAVAVAGGAGRTVEHQRNQFAGEAVDGFAIVAADADAQLHFGRIGDRRARPGRGRRSTPRNSV